MRTLVELFKVLKANKELYISKNCSGLCRLIRELYHNNNISYYEREELLYYVSNNQPTIESKYYHPFSEGSAWYWPLRKWYPRLLWINAQIRELSKKK